MNIHPQHVTRAILLGLAIAMGAIAAESAVPVAAAANLRIGWASADITPDQPVLIAGQMHGRVSEGVADPVTATALALESGSSTATAQVVMVSCDLISIPDSLRDAVRDRLRAALPELDPLAILLNGTHTHTAPSLFYRDRYRKDAEPVEHPFEIDLGVMSPRAYEALAAARIAAAVAAAWTNRAPGGVAYGLGQAVLGQNRLVADRDGKSRMYGATTNPTFSHIEGAEDPGLQALLTYDAERRLTGMILNTACTAQESEHAYQLSADFWHETRLELRQRFGDGLFVLPQTAPAGDQSPHLVRRQAAADRMRRLAGRTPRQELAVRIADAVATMRPLIEREIDWNPILAHRAHTLELPRRRVSEEDAAAARAEATSQRAEFERLRQEFEADPGKRQAPRWYKELTLKHGLARRHERVIERLALQETDPTIAIEVHVARLGDVAFASSPFELYLDYGMQIQERSPAVQTFAIELAGPGTYLPTKRSIAGGAYGAVPASTEVGPESGRLLVDWTVDAMNALWTAAPSPAN